MKWLVRWMDRFTQHLQVLHISDRDTDMTGQKTPLMDSLYFYIYFLKIYTCNVSEVALHYTLCHCWVLV